MIMIHDNYNHSHYYYQFSYFYVLKEEDRRNKVAVIVMWNFHNSINDWNEEQHATNIMKQLN